MKQIYHYFKNKNLTSSSKKWTGRLIFIGLGLSSTLWFLIRVGAQTFTRYLSVHAGCGAFYVNFRDLPDFPVGRIQGFR